MTGARDWAKKALKTVLVDALYALPAEKVELSKEESTSGPVDLQQLLKELKNLQVKVGTQIKQVKTPQNPPQQPKAKKNQNPQVQCENMNVETQGAMAPPAKVSWATGLLEAQDGRPGVLQGQVL